jgi:hypothetical protein
MGPRWPWAIIGGALILVLLAAYVLARGYPDEIRARLSESGPSAPVVDLHGVDQLKAAFNADTGTARLVLLFSPT